MKPAPFTYLRPDSLPAALAVLAERGETAKALAGGQSLVPLLNLRLARPEYVVDIGRLPGLDGIALADDGALAVGALVTHRALGESSLVRGRAPLLAECVPLIGHPAIRNRGTVGGSLAHADPAAELPAALVALDATLRVASTRGEREVAAADFFVDLFTTALAPDELLLAARLPPPPPRTGWAVLELARRHGDFALAGAVAGLTLDRAGACEAARLVLFGVGATPVRAHDAEALLMGQRLTDTLLTAAATRATAALDPP